MDSAIHAFREALRVKAYDLSNRPTALEIHQSLIEALKASGRTQEAAEQEEQLAKILSSRQK